ncbi:hypothetical protein [Parenemella sanctibonifatiensis]|uniref:Uncharacterized protein n=1 Tax=Parenemella sanctibonifatiensis TaxID=2016505 RepID=A0A255EMQ1_9ACTN|nr:hypothetical protein [Parenemella sanctibonifatiensis]OYN90732.1 hypothetical protein CGZ92_00875 [Parenemella sanctibonifatiensis]
MSTPPGVPARAEPFSGARLDPDDLPREVWPSPKHRARWARRILLVLVVVLAMLLAVWAGGGFERRTDDVVWVEPGEVVANGGYAIALERATAKPMIGGGWAVDLSGTCRNESAPTEILPVNQVLVADPAQLDTIVLANSVTIASSDSAVLPLGGWNRPCTFHLLISDWEPGSEIQVAIWEKVWTDVSFTGLGDQDWIDGTRGWRMMLPLTVVVSDVE